MNIKLNVSSVSDKDIHDTKEALVNIGFPPSEVDVILHTVGLILLQTELYPECVEYDDI